MKEKGEDVVARNCQRFSVEPKALLSTSRSVPVARARQRVMLDLFVSGWRMIDIGRFLGRDHATVSKGIRVAINSLLRMEDQMKHHMVRHPDIRPVDTSHISQRLLRNLARDARGLPE